MSTTLEDLESIAQVEGKSISEEPPDSQSNEQTQGKLASFNIVCSNETRKGRRMMIIIEFEPSLSEAQAAS